jgi:hypothetical protein
MTEPYPFQLMMNTITCISRRDGPIIFPITLHAPSSYANFPSEVQKYETLYVLPSNLLLTMLIFLFICPYNLIIASLSSIFLTSTLNVRPVPCCNYLFWEINQVQISCTYE